MTEFFDFAAAHPWLATLWLLLGALALSQRPFMLFRIDHAHHHRHPERPPES